MKKIIGMLLVLCMVFSVSVTSFANDAIYVTIDGNYVEFDVMPRIINGRTMVPIRAIFEKMGAVVGWDGDSSTAFCVKGDTVVAMTVNSTNMIINNQTVKMDVCPVVIDNRTLAPARYVAEAFGATVVWDEASRTVVISSGYALPENKVTIYAPDGRTAEVPESELAAYLNLGWYANQTQALSANKITNTAPTPATPSYSAPAPSAEYNPGPNGKYYRTPTGSKYHLDPNCGGKNSYETTNISGLGPCAKCAK